MASDEKKKQVNVDFSKDPDLLTELDDMVKADESDRSKFIRKLVRQEAARRADAGEDNQPQPVKKNNRSSQPLAV